MRKVNFLLPQIALLCCFLGALSACSGGHVTMVYENGRNIEGKTAEDIVTRMGLAEENPALADGILVDLKAAPESFNWSLFWNELRKNPKFLHILSPEQKNELLALSAKIGSSTEASNAYESFARFVIDRGIGFNQLMSVSRGIRFSLSPDLVLQSLKLANEEDADAVSDYLIVELEKADPRWTTLMSLQAAISPWINKSIDLALATAQKNVESEDSADSFKKLARIEALLDDKKVDTQFLKDAVARKIVSGLASRKQHDQSAKIGKSLAAKFPRLATSSEIWRHDIKLDRDSPLLENSVSLLRSIKHLCPEDSQLSTALFDQATYARFIQYLLDQDNALKLVLDPILPCVEKMSPALLTQIVDRVATDAFPRRASRLETVDTLDPQELTNNFVFLLSRSLTSNTVDVTDVASLLSNEARERAITGAMTQLISLGLSMNKEKEPFDLNWHRIVDTLVAVYPHLPADKQEETISVIAQGLIRFDNVWSEGDRTEALARVYILVKDELALIAEEAPAELPVLAKALFGSRDFSEQLTVELALKSALIQVIPQHKIALETIENDLVKWNSLLNLMSLGRSKIEDILENKAMSYTLYKTIGLKVLMPENVLDESSWKRFMQDTLEVAKQRESLGSKVDIHIYEKLRFRLRLIREVSMRLTDIRAVDENNNPLNHSLSLSEEDLKITEEIAAQVYPDATAFKNTDAVDSARAALLLARDFTASLLLTEVYESNPRGWVHPEHPNKTFRSKPHWVGPHLVRLAGQLNSLEFKDPLHVSKMDFSAKALAESYEMHRRIREGDQTVLYRKDIDREDLKSRRGVVLITGITEQEQKDLVKELMGYGYQYPEELVVLLPHGTEKDPSAYSVLHVHYGITLEVQSIPKSDVLFKLN